MRTRILHHFLVGLICSLAVVISCTKKTSELDEFSRSETLWVNWGTEPPTLDWTLANDIVSNNILYNLMEPLVGIDLSSPDLPAKPALLTTWSSSPDYREWTFMLRPDVVWTDGVALSQKHILDGFERLLNPTTAAEGAASMYCIDGAEEYHKGQIKDFAKVGIRFDTENKLKITLRDPLVFFPMVLTTLGTAPFRSDIAQKHGSSWTEPKNLVTLGPYKLKEWRHDERIVLERNDSYFGDKPKIRYIVGRMIVNLSSAADLFEAGKLDLHRGLAPLDEKRFFQKSELVIQPSLAVLYLNFNTRAPPFDRVDARRAIVQAIDRAEVLKTIGSHRKLNTAWLPTGLLGAIPDQGLSFDPKQAQKLFQKLPLETQQKLQKLRIESNQNETHHIMLQNIQAQLKKNLNLEIELHMMEWKTYLAQIERQPAAIFRLGFISLYPDPHFLMSIWHSTSQFNYTGWKSTQYDQLVNQAAIETQVLQREQLYHSAQRILIEESPFFSIYTAANLTLLSKRVLGYQPNALERLDFKTLSLVAP